MKKIFFIAFATFCFPLVNSCKKNTITTNVSCNNPTNDTILASNLIIGNWKWVSEYVFIRNIGSYVTKTPANTGVLKKLLFRDDNTIKLYQNDTLKTNGTYLLTSLYRITNQVNDKTINIIKITNYLSPFLEFPLFSICNDSLILDYSIYSDSRGLEKWSKIR